MYLDRVHAVGSHGATVAAMLERTAQQIVSGETAAVALGDWAQMGDSGNEVGVRVRIGHRFRMKKEKGKGNEYVTGTRLIRADEQRERREEPGQTIV